MAYRLLISCFDPFMPVEVKMRWAMKWLMNSWPMYSWSRKHTTVLFVAMVVAVAAVFFFTNYVRG
jgi:hypothetical protein